MHGAIAAGAKPLVTVGTALANENSLIRTKMRDEFSGLLKKYVESAHKCLRNI